MNTPLPKTISAMTLRRHVGSLLDEVRMQSRTLIVERAGKPIAKIVPLEENDTAAQDERERKMDALHRMERAGGVTARGKNPEAWLVRERGSWGRVSR